VRTVFPEVPVLPVRTDGVIPKEKITEVMRELYTITVDSRIGILDVVAENVLGLGVNIITTSNILKEL
jgi:CxxC motif-containing protein